MGKLYIREKVDWLVLSGLLVYLFNPSTPLITKPDGQVLGVSDVSRDIAYEATQSVSTPTPVAARVASETVHVEAQPKPEQGEIVQIVDAAAAEFGVDRTMMQKIVRCESGYNPKARNGQYAGLFQFANSTWRTNRSAMGLDTNLDLRFDAREASRTAAYKMSRDGFGAWKDCAF